MILKHITLTNFMGWSSLDIDLSRYSGVTAVLGVIDSDVSHSNGTGKSALITAILFAIYGKQVIRNMDDLIMQGKLEDGFKVALRFSHGGQEYEVIRKKKKGAQQRIQFKNITTDSLLTGEPENLLKIPMAVWENTVFSSQGNMAGFVDQTPSVRKDILTEIFGMKNYLDLEASARSAYGKHSDKATEIRAKLDILKDQRSGLAKVPDMLRGMAPRVAKVEVELSATKAEKTRLTAELSAATTVLESSASLQATLSEVESEYDRIIGKELGLCSDYANETRKLKEDIRKAEAVLASPVPNIEELEARCADRRSASLKLKELGEEANRLLASKESARADMDVLLYRKQQLNESIRKVSAVSGACPTCGSDITEGHRNSYIEDIQVQLRELEKSINESDQTIRNICIELDNIRGIYSQYQDKEDTLRDAEDQYMQAKTCVLERDYASKAKSDYERRLAELEASHAETLAEIAEARSSLSARRDSILNDMSGFTKLKDAVASLVSSLASVDETIRGLDVQYKELSAEYGRLDAMFLELSRIESDINMYTAELESVEEAKRIYSELVKAFGPSGIPTLILENCLTELQSYLDSYMDLLSDGRIKVKFRTTKVSSTNKISETLDILVSDINGERDLSMYSGGERVRIYLAIRLALAKLMSQKLGNELGVMILDEISDLDDAGLNSFIELLKSVGNDFAQIFLVSHLPELKNAFSGALVLERDIYGKYIGRQS